MYKISNLSKQYQLARLRRSTSEPMLPSLDAGHLCVGPSLQVESNPAGISQLSSQQRAVANVWQAAISEAGCIQQTMGWHVTHSSSLLQRRCEQSEADNPSNQSRIRCLSIFLYDIVLYYVIGLNDLSQLVRNWNWHCNNL